MNYFAVTLIITVNMSEMSGLQNSQSSYLGDFNKWAGSAVYSFNQPFGDWLLCLSESVQKTLLKVS